MQREAAITQAEKNRVAVSLYGLALSHPNPEFWTTIASMDPCRHRRRTTAGHGRRSLTAQVGMEVFRPCAPVDPNTGKVVDRRTPMYKNMPGAIPLQAAWRGPRADAQHEDRTRPAFGREPEEP